MKRKAQFLEGKILYLTPVHFPGNKHRYMFNVNGFLYLLYDENLTLPRLSLIARFWQPEDEGEEEEEKEKRAFLTFPCGNK